MAGSAGPCGAHSLEIHLVILLVVSRRDPWSFSESLALPQSARTQQTPRAGQRQVAVSLYSKTRGPWGPLCGTPEQEATEQTPQRMRQTLKKGEPSDRMHGKSSESVLSS